MKWPVFLWNQHTPDRVLGRVIACNRIGVEIMARYFFNLSKARTLIRDLV